MAADAQSGYRYMQRGVASTSRNVEAASARVLSESTGLATATESYRAAAATHLSNLRQTTQTLVEQGTREDMPTGLTPRKHSWNYVDEWQLTQSREILLKDWRQRNPSSSNSDDTFLAEHLPLPEGEDAYESPEEMVVNEDPADKMEDLVDSPMSDDSPTVKSLSSSASSASLSSATSIPSHPPVVGLKKTISSTIAKSGLPTMGTLTERSTNVLGARGSRRLQR